MKVLEAPLDVISERARPYPAHLLNDCVSGLCLFAAAFQGHNDAIHMARQEMNVICVDIDSDRLAEMAKAYPMTWLFFEMDAWDFALHSQSVGNRWDAISVDTFTGDAMERSLASLDLWCSLADRVVTVGVMNDSEWTAPEGWHGSLFPRSEDVSWLVMTR